MKKYLLLLTTIIVVYTAEAQRRDQAPYLVKNFKTSAINDLQVNTSGGSIRVEGGSGDARVEVFVEPSSSDMRKLMSNADIKEMLEQYYTLDIRTDGNTLIAKAQRKDRNWSNKTALSISFKIYTGTRVSTNLGTSGGSITLGNLSGNQQFKTSGGSLNIKNIKGKITGKTSGGSINLEDADDDINLTTSGGSISANDCSGTIRLKTSGGSLSLSNLSGTINAHTSGGSVTGDNIKGDFITGTSGGSITLDRIDGNVEATTSAGSVHVEMTGLKNYIKLRTSSGGIYIKVPDTKNLELQLKGNKVNTGDLDGFRGKLEKDRVEGTLGNGKTLVEAKAVNGGITLNR